MVNKKRKRTVNNAALACMVILFLGGCGYGSEAGDNKAETESTGGSKTVREAETSREVIEKIICRSIQNLDFSVREAPVNTAQYDAGIDRNYKTAFLKAVTNQIPILDQNEEVYYKDILQNAGGLDEAAFLRLIRQSDFYYQDFNGDGLPELTVNTEGPCVLKYNPDEERVELYFQKGPGWNLLGAGQMYYYSHGYVENNKDGIFRMYPKDVTVIMSEYAYETVELGKAKQNVYFYNILTSDQSADWVTTCKVSINGSERIEVEEEEWGELARGYFTAAGEAPHPMSFDVMFREDENGDFMKEDEPDSRYMPDDTELLPLNEETGVEWEAYKRMMEGDFSLVEDESGRSLQSRYESNLEEGNGRCSWSYFLMDFNQDGQKELCIRYYNEGVNNTAYFRYENGHVRMWGSYDSADSHGYDIPLANGKVISVSWYQSDKIIWISRLNPECVPIKERSYSTGITDDEDSQTNADKLTEEDYFYIFQDYYMDGELCGAPVDLTKEEMDRINGVIEELLIPEDKWKSCSVFTPMPVRPEIPSVG